MAGEDGRGRRSRQTVAVVLVLCSLAPSLTCFSLRGPSKKVNQNRVVSEATVMEVRTGSILFNGKELDSQSGSASAAATGNDGLHIELDQSDGTGMWERTSQLEDAMANEAAWMRLNPSLHCGENKMKLKAMGPGAADLQLDMGNARPLSLIQVPETCGYSMKQNALGLILVVPYDGCSVIQENGNYVLPMSWLETSVKFTCPISTSSATPASTTLKPAQQPWKLPFPHGLWSLSRRKRQTNQPLPMYDPRSPYYAYLYYYYYMYMMTPAPAPGTTAKPGTTTMTTKPSTEKPPQIKPPVYPYYPYYPFYPYYPYYPLPNLPVKTTTPPATTTTAKPTTGPGTSGMTAEMTTTAKMMTITKTTQKPPSPYYPPYFPYPYYPPAGQQMPGIPDNSEIYYYPVIQHFYGKPPYPQIPNQSMQTTLPPTLTTAKPDDTAKPTDSSPTTKPTTAPTVSAPTAQTTKPSSGSYPGPMSPYVPYNQLPFVPYVSYNKAGKLPDDQKYMPQAGFKSGLQARAPPHLGFHYWQPVPWFPHSTGQDNPQFNLKKPTT